MAMPAPQFAAQPMRFLPPPGAMPPGQDFAQPGSQPPGMDPAGMQPPPMPLPRPGAEMTDGGQLPPGVTIGALQPQEPQLSDLNAEGLPGHRLDLMYLAWITSKQGELADQLVWDRYYHGTGHWTDQQLAVLAKRKQPNTYFNECRKKINSYIGIEQRLRRDPKAYPVSPKHEGDTDAATAALRQVDSENNCPTIFSDAGRDFFVRGIGVVWQGIELEADELCIRNRHIPSINFLYDPRSMKWDFSDAKFMGEWGWFDIDDAEELMMRLGRPDSARKIMSLADQDGRARSGGVPGEWARVKGGWFSRELSRVRLVHMYYKHKGEWRCAYFCGSIKLYDAPSVYRDEKTGRTRQPFNAVSCDVDETGLRYGAMKDLIPIQDAINQRHSKLLWMMNVRQVIMEKGAVDDPEKARAEAARPDGIIILNPRSKDGNVERRFQLVTLDAQIEGQVRLLESALQMMQNYGPNTAILGKGDGVEQASGRALLARQNAGMTEMSPIFDRHRQLKISSYRNNWMLIRQFWTAERWIAVTDDEKGVKFVGLNFEQRGPGGQPVLDQNGMPVMGNDVAKMDVDITIEEGPDTVVMNEELMERFAQLGEAAMGPLGKILIHLSNAPNKDYLFSMIDKANAPNPEIEEMQKRMAQLEQLLLATKVDQGIATVEKTRADTIASLTSSMVTPQLLQAFPLQFGVPSMVEQAIGEPLNPASFATMGNAFADHGVIKASLDASRAADQADQAHGRQMAAKQFDVANRPPPAPVRGRPTASAAPPRPSGPPPGPMPRPQGGMPGPQQMPGQEPVMGAPGGLPMPSGAQGQAMTPPPGAMMQ